MEFVNYYRLNDGVVLSIGVNRSPYYIDRTKRVFFFFCIFFFLSEFGVVLFCLVIVVSIIVQKFYHILDFAVDLELFVLFSLRNDKAFCTG